MDRIIVAGASLAGLRSVESLRAHGFHGEIVAIGDETHPPYTRPPLSKTSLTTSAPLDEVLIPYTAEATWKLGRKIVGCNLDGGRVALDDGSSEDFDGLVIATGLRARRLTIPGPVGGRHVLRTLEDARELAGELQPGRTVLIVGASFIACEVASSARARNCRVIVVAPEDHPMLRVVGAEVGAALQARHAADGVEFHLGTLPVRFEGTDRVTGVVLNDGTELPVDVVVEAVGCSPSVDWLAGNRLDLTDGVLCDNTMRVIGTGNAVAVGDVARFPNPLFDTVPRRIEHWTMAGDTADRAAGSLLGVVPDHVPFTPLPSFWSDQLGVRIQGFGVPALAEEYTLVSGSLDADFAVAGYRENTLVAVFGIGRRRDVSRLRTELLDSAVNSPV